MNTFIKTYWKTLLFFAIVGLVGGFFTGIYILDSYPAELQAQLVEELKQSGLGDLSADMVLGAVTAVQSALYGVILGAVGIVLAKKIGLWKDERTLEKKPVIVTSLCAIFGGLLLILPDVLFFGKYSEVIMASYAAKPTVPYILASVSYGAVIEEVMLRLFAMSLVAYILHRLFGKGSDKPQTKLLVLSNVIAALLFAVGHLPATVLMIGSTPLVIIRCFLLNGGFGLLFGYLYRKYGLRYAMLAHGGCHVVSKLIWILFL